MKGSSSPRGQRHIRAKLVETECLRVIDSTGTLRAQLVTIDDSTWLSLYDSEERITVWLKVLYDGRPELWFFGPDENARALLSTNLSGTARLFLKDSYGRETEISTRPYALTVKLEPVRRPVGATPRGWDGADRIRHWRMC